MQEQFTPTADLLFLYPSDSFESRAHRNDASIRGEAGTGFGIGATDEQRMNYTNMREAERKASQSILSSVAGLGERRTDVLFNGIYSGHA